MLGVKAIRRRLRRRALRRNGRKRDASSQPPAPAVPASPALEVLGLGAGASPEEINAAYKRMARTYHPDKVAGEAQEVREFAEEKMKEINAAYSELKRRG